MPKLLDTPITAADLEAYLREHDDFALERDILRVALELGLVVEHGGTYTDAATGKPRQFDLRLGTMAQDRQILLSVECKNLGKNCPLLVSRIPRERDEAFHQVLHSHAERPPGSVPGVPRDHAAILEVAHQGSLYPVGALVGKDTAQVGRTLGGELTGNDGDVYEKWGQALASAHELVARALTSHEHSTSGNCLSLVIPMLVIADETLWTADYSSKGELVAPPHPAQEALLYVGRDYLVGHHTRYRISHLHVYTRSKFCVYLEDLMNTDATWKKAFPHGLIPCDASQVTPSK